MPELIRSKSKVKELGITPEDVINYISAGDTPDREFFYGLAADGLEKIKNEDVLWGYMSMPAKLTGETLIIGDTGFNVGRDVSLMLRTVNEIALFACTVSPELDKNLNAADFGSDHIEAYLNDIIGTVILGKVTDKVHEKVKAAFSGKKITNTISPGNCGWPVEDQKILWKLLPERFLGIRLNDSGMMEPVKSLSGIIGIGENVKYMQTECRYCRSRNCPYRKEPSVY